VQSRVKCELQTNDFDNDFGNHSYRRCWLVFRSYWLDLHQNLTDSSSALHSLTIITKLIIFFDINISFLRSILHKYSHNNRLGAHETGRIISFGKPVHNALAQNFFSYNSVVFFISRAIFRTIQG
jgi:hypothetical protein